MRRALLASLVLHGALLAVLLMQQGSVAPAPAALTVQLLPPATALAQAGTAQARRASKAPSRAPARPVAAAARVSAAAPGPAAVAAMPQAVVSAAANPAPVQASVTPAPAGPLAAGGAANSEGSSRPPLADRAARVLQMPPPDYPPLSRERGEQGVVMLQLAVDASGRLGEVSVLQSSGFSRLDKAARAAVQRWRFQPAIENGQPVAAQLTLPVRFALDEN